MLSPNTTIDIATNATMTAITARMGAPGSATSRATAPPRARRQYPVFDAAGPTVDGGARELQGCSLRGASSGAPNGPADDEFSPIRWVGSPEPYRRWGHFDRSGDPP